MLIDLRFCVLFLDDLKDQLEDVNQDIRMLDDQVRVLSKTLHSAAAFVAVVTKCHNISAVACNLQYLV